MVSRDTERAQHISYLVGALDYIVLSSVTWKVSQKGEAMPSLKVEALAYARRGWPIFPCNANKQPMVPLEEGGHGVLDATTNIEQVTRWWDRWPHANIGLDVAGAGFMVVDADQYKESFDPALYKVLQLPATGLQAESPRGGTHLYYSIGAKETIANSSDKLAPAVDVRSFHGYVLLPPSRTVAGVYSWTSEGKAAYRTDEMVRLSNTAREKHSDRDKWIITPDLEENISSAVAWLKTKAKIAVQGQGGDHIAYATAAYMKSFGISEALALDLMWDHWNPRCSPPWSSNDFEHFEKKINNGYSYNTSPPGNITPAYKVAKAQLLFTPVARSLPRGREFTNGKFRVTDRAGMEHIKAPAWLIHDVIPQGAYVLLVGAHETFKTFVALDMALSIATGAGYPWPGLWGDLGGTGPVLFAAGEGRPAITKRVKAWEKTYYGGKEAENFFLTDPVPSVNGAKEEWDVFIDNVKRMDAGAFSLIVLDTVGRAMQGVNENAQEHASNFTQLVGYLQRGLGDGLDNRPAVMGLHHTGYDHPDRARGSSVFYADPDTVLHIDREEKAMSVTLNMSKQKDAPEWEKPRRIMLLNVNLTNKVSSLVAAKPSEQEDIVPYGKRSQVKHDRRTQAQARDVREGVSDEGVRVVGKPWTYDAIDAAIVRVLQGNPSVGISLHALAERVAMDPDVNGLKAQSLEKVHIPRLVVDKTRKAHRCFDPAANRKTAWRFKA